MFNSSKKKTDEILVSGNIYFLTETASIEDVEAFVSELTYFRGFKVHDVEYDFESSGFVGEEEAKLLEGRGEPLYGCDIFVIGISLSIEADPTSDEYVQEVVEEAQAAWRFTRNKVNQVAKRNGFLVAKES